VSPNRQTYLLSSTKGYALESHRYLSDMSWKYLSQIWGEPKHWQDNFTWLAWLGFSEPIFLACNRKMGWDVFWFFLPAGSPFFSLKLWGRSKNYDSKSFQKGVHTILQLVLYSQLHFCNHRVSTEPIILTYTSV